MWETSHTIWYHKLHFFAAFIMRNVENKQKRIKPEVTGPMESSKVQAAYGAMELHLQRVQGDC